jgi:lipoyl(octanoyl) transferase
MASARLTWRLIDTGPLDGATNMALDEALLACFDPQSSRPILRLYGWEPPALSLGRFQKAAEVLDLERCAAEQVPVVRRITGGGVIYHADELTYSLVCAPHQIPPHSSIKDSFRVLTSFILRFYERLGLAPAYAVDALPGGTRLGARTPFCFAGRETYDIVVGRRKIGGNAQRRLKNTIFQHGSIPLANHAARGAGFLRERPSGLAETAALAGFGIKADVTALKGLLVAAFAEALAASIETDGPTPEEEAMTAVLAQRHASDAWVLAGETETP